MNILSIHISDLHLSSKKQIDESRFRNLSSSIPSLLPEKPHLVILLIGGDIVERGEIAFYSESKRLIELAKVSISENFPDSEILVAAVPGNHDHDFSEEQTARDAILKTIQTGDKVSSFKGSLIDTLLEPQQEFFKTTAALSDGTAIEPLSDSIDTRVG